MSSSKKLLQSSSGYINQSGGGEVGDGLFKTHLYLGTASSLAINNGIDLSGEGGLVILTARNASGACHVFDTERGAKKKLEINTGTEVTRGSNEALDSFNSNGFTISSDSANDNLNTSNRKYVSWTFRKASKFFDVVTYTGNGTAGRTISHSLDTTVGAVIIKNLTNPASWAVYHRGVGNDTDDFGESNYLKLNSQNAISSADPIWNYTVPTSSTITLGSDSLVNDSNTNYVAYIFADHNSDGTFGHNGNEDFIKCGSYTGDSGGNRKTVTLGFEPQWLLIKNISSGSTGWIVVDDMRGFPALGKNLYADFRSAVLELDSQSENFYFSNSRDAKVHSFSDGFILDDSNMRYNNNNDKYIYIAIKKPLTIATSGADVYSAISYTGNGSSGRTIHNPSGHVVDQVHVFSEGYHQTQGWYMSDPGYRGSRVTGPTYMRIHTNNAEVQNTQRFNAWDVQDGVRLGNSNDTNGNQYPYYAQFWTRRRGAFTIVNWLGDGQSYTRLIKHDLGVKPEMIIIKNRNEGTYNGDWDFRHKDLTVMDSTTGFGSYATRLYLNKSDSESSYSSWIEGPYTIAGQTNTGFTSETISPRLSYADNNANGEHYIAYLYASVDGVIKVGSYTGNGNSNGDSQTIDCGFSSGLRYLLVKRKNSTGYWHEFNYAWGFDSYNNPASGGDIGWYTTNNSRSVLSTSVDNIDHHTSGFTVNYYDGSGHQGNLNGNNYQYIFLAVAK